MTPALYRVRRRRVELEDTVTLELEEATGRSRLDFAPGQFTMLYSFGVGEIPISISGDAEQGETLVQTIRRVGAVSTALAQLKKGATLGVRGPFGSAWPVHRTGCDVVLVAGGIGLAPLRPALYHLARHREQYGRITLVYGARTPDMLLYPAELERWRRSLEVLVTVDHADDKWRGHVGVVTTLLPRVAFDPEKTVAMVCGPEIMMRFVAEGLLQRGVSASQLFISLERNMHCALGTCGHCQLGGLLVCRDGPVLSYDRVAPLLATREL